MNGNLSYVIRNRQIWLWNSQGFLYKSEQNGIRDKSVDTNNIFHDIILEGQGWIEKGIGLCKEMPNNIIYRYIKRECLPFLEVFFITLQKNLLLNLWCCITSFHPLMSLRNLVALWSLSHLCSFFFFFTPFEIYSLISCVRNRRDLRKPTNKRDSSSSSGGGRVE